jgi:hypothetical protein
MLLLTLISPLSALTQGNVGKLDPNKPWGTREDDVWLWWRRLSWQSWGDASTYAAKLRELVEFAALLVLEGLGLTHALLMADTFHPM